MSEPLRDVASWRAEYADRGLDVADLDPDPIVSFRRWLDDAAHVGLHEPNAMVLSTSGPEGPASRMVLLKSVDARGFAFFTNYGSRKGHELVADPACALLFPWHPVERQVRVEGYAQRLSPEESDAYFATRPRGSQLGAWASPQSEQVPDREWLEERYAATTDRFVDTPLVPRPAYWGGFLVRPHRIEFWQGRPGRMHDRLRFDRLDDGCWQLERLAP